MVVGVRSTGPAVPLCQRGAGAIGGRVDADHRFLLVSVVRAGTREKGEHGAHLYRCGNDAGGYYDTIALLHYFAGATGGDGARHARACPCHSRESGNPHSARPRAFGKTDF